jgi:hypothetical protein
MGNNSSVENYYGSLERPGWSEPALRYLVSVFSFYLLFYLFNALHNHFEQKVGHRID